MGSSNLRIELVSHVMDETTELGFDCLNMLFNLSYLSLNFVSTRRAPAMG